jgi:hypothetical protein
MSTPETTPIPSSAPVAPSSPPAETHPAVPAKDAKDGKDNKGNKGGKGKGQSPPAPPTVTKPNDPPKQPPSALKSDEVEVDLDEDEGDEGEEVVLAERTPAERVASIVEKVAPPAPPPVRTACPVVGAKLQCETFEGDTSVICEVESVVEEEGVFVVRMPGLGDRRWPFSVERLHGNRLEYAPQDYPAIGTNPSFDSRFRKHLKNVELTRREQDLLSKSQFTPPRKARAGYTWVKVVSGPISMAGFSYDNKPVKGEHPMSKDEKSSYLEVLVSTAKPLFPEKVLMDCGVG